MLLKKLLVLGLFTLSLPGCSGCTGYRATAECTKCDGKKETVSSAACTEANAAAFVAQLCPPGKLGPITYTSAFFLDGCDPERSSAALSSDIPFTSITKNATSLADELSRALFGNTSGSSQATAGESCSLGVQFTFKIIHNAECDGKELYYTLKYQGPGGAQEIGPIAVAAGATGTQTVVAADADRDGRADVFEYNWRVGDPDPSLACGTGDHGRDGLLANGETLTVTVDPDGGSYSEVITPAPNGSARTGGETISTFSGNLVPVPDPNFAERAQE